MHIKNSNGIGWKRHNHEVGITKNIPLIKENKTQSPDSINRKNVIEKICEFIQEGMTLDEAASILSSDEEIRKNFSYLTKAGLDLKTLFSGWYASYNKNFNNKDEKGR